MMPDSSSVHPGNMMECQVHCAKCSEWSCHLEAVCQPLSRRKDQWRLEREGPKGGLPVTASGPATRRGLLSSSRLREAIVERPSRCPLCRGVCVHTWATALRML